LLEKGEKEESHRLQLIEQFADFTHQMKANLTNLNFEERRQVVRLLVEEVIVNTQTEEITVRHILPLDQKFPLCKGSTLTLTLESDAGSTRQRVREERPPLLPVCGRLCEAEASVLVG
jgi:hypothetical protein